MSRYELTIDPDYVPNWTVLDALREIFQNALDESSLHPDNSMDIIRDGTTIKICTKNASLSKSTLLIGNSTKRDDDTTIGSHGEGYKLAALVLTRLGYPVTIHNYSERELWIPKIIKSRRFNSKLLVFDTEKFFWKLPPDNDLTFEIQNISDEIYKQLKDRVLHLRDHEYDVIDTDFGSILLDNIDSGKIFVNGLYVTTIKEGFKYGYDIKPEYIKLDRDRREVNGFDLAWTTSRIWSSLGDNDLIHELINNNFNDVKYVNSTISFGDQYRIRDNVVNSFVEDYGENAIPVKDQSEYDDIQSTYSNAKPIIVNEIKHELIKNSPTFEEREHSLVSTFGDNKSPSEILSEFFENFEYELSSNGKESFNRIIELSENWS